MKKVLVLILLYNEPRELETFVCTYDDNSHYSCEEINEKPEEIERVELVDPTEKEDEYSVEF